MSILTILIVVVLVGLVLWLINSYIPMDGKIKTILNIAVVVFLIIWLLKGLGIFSSLSNVHV